MPWIRSGVRPAILAESAIDEVALVKKSPWLTIENAVSKELVSIAILGGLIQFDDK